MALREASWLSKNPWEPSSVWSGEAEGVRENGIFLTTLGGRGILRETGHRSVCGSALGLEAQAQGTTRGNPHSDTPLCMWDCKPRDFWRVGATLTQIVLVTIWVLLKGQGGGYMAMGVGSRYRGHDLEGRSLGCEHR